MHTTTPFRNTLEAVGILLVLLAWGVGVTALVILLVFLVASAYASATFICNAALHLGFGMPLLSLKKLFALGVVEAVAFSALKRLVTISVTSKAKAARKQ